MLGLGAGLVLLLSGCASGAAEPVLPPAEGVFDYQLGGAYDEVGGEPIDVVVRDAAADPLADAYSVCYVNGFQTQPGDDAWPEEVLLRDADGSVVVDPDWPDERVLDPSTAEQRRAILEILAPIIEGCASGGFDAVEIDNLDTWTRFDAIDEEGARELARAYVDVAHEAGLAVAQKNAAEIAEVARDELGFDFAVTEECAAWGECGAYADAYGDRVLQIEYPEALDEAGMTFADACEAPGRAPLAILRDRDLVPVGSPGHLREAC
ncbi:endo alpha-1,4 polygalactosaminidase [Microbacterium sp. gxy059]|uniref:endo alpha-1,4 polygalactosaminidase n=1 Tax=Microbacterium sp. gxy059 TaxID=2957199 RepID=UPI003D996DEF